MTRFAVKEVADSEANPFDRQQRISWWRQDLVRNARIMIVGAGAIGNETIKNLVLLGFRNLLICDFDTISVSNLSRTVLFRRNDVGKPKAEIAALRAQEMALENDPCISFFNGDIVWDLGLGTFRAVDVVLGCVDNVEARLHINRCCQLLRRPWIDSGMQELASRVSIFDGVNLPCYECGITDTQRAGRHQRYSCDNVKKAQVAAGRVPTVQAAASLVASLQTQELVRIVCNDRSNVGKMLFFQGQSNSFDVFGIKPNDNCSAHVNLPEVVPLPLSADLTLRTFLETVSDPDLSGPGASLDLQAERSFVLEAECRTCRRPLQLMRPRHHLSERDLQCRDEIQADCAERSSTMSMLDPNSATRMTEVGRFSLSETAPEILNRPLRALGVPSFHILTVMSAAGRERQYELSADRGKVLGDWG